MLIISHRGYHVRAHENTIEAFEQALSMGADGIETDVCLTRDGQPILFHDRVTPGGSEVSTLSLAELTDAVGYSVPTLAELEELISRSSPGLLWNLEVKHPEALGATTSAILRLRGSARFLLSSFWHPSVQKAAQAGIDCGLLVCHYPLPPDRAGWPAADSGIGAIVWSFERVDEALIQTSAARGLKNFVYGPITPADHARLTGWKLDGVITDHPEYLISGRA